MTIDLNKPLQTRDGRPVRILATNLKGVYPVAGVVAAEDGTETVHGFCLDGSFYAPGDPDRFDLQNIPEETVEHGNFYPDRTALGQVSWVTYGAASAEDARQGLGRGGVTLKITRLDGKATKVEMA